MVWHLKHSVRRAKLWAPQFEQCQSPSLKATSPPIIGRLGLRERPPSGSWCFRIREMTTASAFRALSFTFQPCSMTLSCTSVEAARSRVPTDSLRSFSSIKRSNMVPRLFRSSRFCSSFISRSLFSASFSSSFSRFFLSKVGFLKHFARPMRLWPEGLSAKMPSAVMPTRPSAMTRNKSQTGTKDQSAGGVPGSRPRETAASALASQPKVFAVWWSARKSPSTRSPSLPWAHFTMSFQRWVPIFRTSKSESDAALSSPLGSTAVMAERHFLAQRQARQPILGCISMAWRRFFSRPFSLPLSWWNWWPGSSLVLQRLSHARSR
mmetsp:Transcript_10019/g.31176  ORF Transcript_10019/g.31176 Transcript_10019/m.31176 type:complete len:322 (-) Transcript_10019:716-1681(-)